MSCSSFSRVVGSIIINVCKSSNYEFDNIYHQIKQYLIYQKQIYTFTSFSFQDTLRAWQEKNHPWLELSDVHKETTENIRVTVIPFYMGYRPAQG